MIIFLQMNEIVSSDLINVEPIHRNECCPLIRSQDNATRGVKLAMAYEGARLLGRGQTVTNTTTKPKAKPGKLGAEKLTPDEQKRRFLEACREAGASEDEADFDAAVKRIAKPEQPS